MFKVAMFWSLLAGFALGPTVEAAVKKAAPAPVTADAERDAYIRRVETQLNDYETKITQIKTDRDRQMRDSDRWKELQRLVDDMSEKVKDARDKLAEMRNAASDKWLSIRSDINTLLAEIDGLQRGSAE